MSAKHTLIAATFASAITPVFAFTPPYHINYPYVGTAKIQTAGSCKIKQIFVNAQWGWVQDSTNASVGYGLLSSAGDLLVKVAQEVPVSGFDISGAGLSQDISLEDLSSPETLAQLSTFGSCTINYLQTSYKAKVVYDRNAPKGKYLATLIAPIGGISPPLVETKGPKTTRKPQIFSGSITFKGNSN